MDAPILVYDDDCGVCTRAALFVDRHADVTIVGFSKLTDELRGRLPPDYERCAHLVTREEVYSCGEAMERAFEKTRLPPSNLLSILRRAPGYALFRERVYRIVARNRPLIGRLLPSRR